MGAKADYTEIEKRDGFLKTTCKKLFHRNAQPSASLSEKGNAPETRSTLNKWVKMETAPGATVPYSYDKSHSGTKGLFKPENEEIFDSKFTCRNCNSKTERYLRYVKGDSSTEYVRYEGPTRLPRFVGRKVTECPADFNHERFVHPSDEKNPILRSGDEFDAAYEKFCGALPCTNCGEILCYRYLTYFVKGEYGAGRRRTWFYVDNYSEQTPRHEFKES